MVHRKESLEVWPEGVPRAGRQPRVQKALVWAWWEGGCPSPSKFPGASELGRCPSRAQGPLCWRLRVSCGGHSCQDNPRSPKGRKRLLPPALCGQPPRLQEHSCTLALPFRSGWFDYLVHPCPTQEGLSLSPLQAPGFRASTPRHLRTKSQDYQPLVGLGLGSQGPLPTQDLSPQPGSPFHWDAPGKPSRCNSADDAAITATPLSSRLHPPILEEEGLCL